MVFQILVTYCDHVREVLMIYFGHVRWVTINVWWLFWSCRGVCVAIIW